MITTPVLLVRYIIPTQANKSFIEDMPKQVRPNLVFGTSGCFGDRRTDRQADELKVFFAF